MDLSQWLLCCCWTLCMFWIQTKCWLLTRPIYLCRLLTQDGVIEAVKRKRYFEKPCTERKRKNYENCRRIYHSEMARKLAFIGRKDREDPWLGCWWAGEWRDLSMDWFILRPKMEENVNLKSLLHLNDLWETNKMGFILSQYSTAKGRKHL